MKNSAAGLLTSLDDLFSTQEEREAAAQPRVEDIPVDLIDDFPNHPFKVRMDGAMVRLVESVGQYGVLEPCLIRPKPDGRYEMVAGHRRKEACIMADCPSIRCIVQEMIFCDLSTPKSDGGFNVYDDLKKKLVVKGIPPEEIAFIHDANTEARKKELFSKVRSGQVRILMGSTAKMGAGTNCQDKLVALHDVDCPWRPSDLAQRLGRIVRQGNQNPEVEIFRYVTENTFDAYLYQLVENKQKFIAQIMTSKAPARIADDVDETALSYSEIKALATGNPLIIEKCNLDVEVSKLNMLKANHLNQRFSLENMVYRRYPAKIAELKEQIAGYEKDVATAQAHPKSTENFVGMEIYGTHHTEKEAAGRAIINACKDLQGSEPVQLGQYRGFSLSLQYIAANTDYKLTIKGAMSHTISLGADIFGNITRMDNVVDGLAKELEAYRTVLQDTQTQLANAKAEMETPFAREKELAEKSARLKELNILLNMDQKDRSVLDDGPQEESPEKEKRKEQER